MWQPSQVPWPPPRPHSPRGAHHKFHGNLHTLYHPCGTYHKVLETTITAGTLQFDFSQLEAFPTSEFDSTKKPQFQNLKSYDYVTFIPSYNNYLFIMSINLLQLNTTNSSITTSRYHEPKKPNTNPTFI